MGTHRVEGYPKYVFLLTDGDVSNGKQIIAKVYTHRSDMRFFTVGIGSGISPLLIQGVAQAGKGNYEFVKDGEDITSKTLYLLHSAVTPLLDNFEITVDDSTLVTKTLPALNAIGSVIKNEPFELYLWLNYDLFMASGGITMSISY